MLKVHGQQQSLALSQPRHVSSKTGLVARNGVTCLVVMLYGSSTYEQRTVMVALAFTCAMSGTRSPSAAETTTVYAPGKTLSCGRTNTRIRAFVPGAAARLTFVLVVFCPSGSCHATRSRPSGSASCSAATLAAHVTESIAVYSRSNACTLLLPSGSCAAERRKTSRGRASVHASATKLSVRLCGCVAAATRGSGLCTVTSSGAVTTGATSSWTVRVSPLSIASVWLGSTVRNGRQASGTVTA